MKALTPLRCYGKLSDLHQQEYLYQLTGQQLGLEYRLELVVTDFVGRGWHSAFALEEVMESMVIRVLKQEMAMFAVRRYSWVHVQ